MSCNLTYIYIKKNQKDNYIKWYRKKDCWSFQRIYGHFWEDEHECPLVSDNF